MKKISAIVLSTVLSASLIFCACGKQGQGTSAPAETTGTEAAATTAGSTAAEHRYSDNRSFARSRICRRKQRRR